ncbi:pectin lyase-like protein [Dacryopinax primogenitus]|uniref:galacturonan 1,4-alpha-galacturonidase n=1 Tax=Dacryopinax primogenitus (strain DJM 731) TaxID=1858805 RepID=M5FW69_DACPD|nr:pectin lyase-like protein [Dacryopinax primogenitus]EJU00614.1 pectin lyase-like protein [Dacryopinax primogenitus]
MALLLVTTLCLVLSAFAQPCVIPHKPHGDDTPSFHHALSTCSSRTLLFSPNTSYNFWTPLGNLSLPRDMHQVQVQVNASASGYWLYFTGKNVTLVGSGEQYWGWINSYGQQWWDSGNQIARPHLLGFAVTNGQLLNLKFHQPIAWTVSLASASNIYVRNTLIDARSTGGFPFNTDGFDATGSDLLIEDSVVLNGDDALAVGQDSIGTRNVTFWRTYVGFHSHGASIGSLGKDPSQPANVSDVLIEDVFFHNTLYGARFKSWVGGTGLARNVTYRNIGCQNVTFPLYITQSYVDQNSPGGARVNNASVVMRDFTYDGFWGTINTYQPGDESCISDPCWYYEPGADRTQAILFRCNPGACQDFSVQNINLRPENGVPATIICNNPAVNSSNPGYECVNGTFVPLY